MIKDLIHFFLIVLLINSFNLISHLSVVSQNVENSTKSTNVIHSTGSLTNININNSKLILKLETSDSSPTVNTSFDKKKEQSNHYNFVQSSDKSQIDQNNSTSTIDDNFFNDLNNTSSSEIVTKTSIGLNITNKNKIPNESKMEDDFTENLILNETTLSPITTNSGSLSTESENLPENSNSSTIETITSTTLFDYTDEAYNNIDLDNNTIYTETEQETESEILYTDTTQTIYFSSYTTNPTLIGEDEDRNYRDYTTLITTTNNLDPFAQNTTEVDQNNITDISIEISTETITKNTTTTNLDHFTQNSTKLNQSNITRFEIEISTGNKNETTTTTISPEMFDSTFNELITTELFTETTLPVEKSLENEQKYFKNININISQISHINSNKNGEKAIPKDELYMVAVAIASVLSLGLLILLAYAFRNDKLNCRGSRDRVMSSVKPRPLSIKGFLRHCIELNETPARLASEFQLLASLTEDISRDDRLLIGRLPENRRRNRYINILPFDDNRVKLRTKSSEVSDYINASFIKGYSNRVEYIATQGPKEETCQHFWQMVYDDRVVVIAMVTQLEESHREKCYAYYPKLREQMSWDDDKLIVYCVSEVELPVYTARTFNIYKGTIRRVVTHLHFREWADFKCPETTESMIEFCQVTRQHLSRPENHNGLILVHCSAGVGRTGTFITVDILLQAVAEARKIDVFGTVFRLRHERMMMVQTDTQYTYIYKCIEDAISNGKFTNNSKISTAEPIYENIPMTIITERHCSKDYNNQVNEYDDCHINVVNENEEINNESTQILLDSDRHKKKFIFPFFIK